MVHMRMRGDVRGWTRSARVRVRVYPLSFSLTLIPSQSPSGACSTVKRKCGEKETETERGREGGRERGRRERWREERKEKLKQRDKRKKEDDEAKTTPAQTRHKRTLGA